MDENVQEQTVELTVGDVVEAHEMIRAVSMRGAFRAEELSTVGKLFDKLTKILLEKGVIKQVITTPEKE